MEIILKFASWKELEQFRMEPEKAAPKPEKAAPKPEKADPKPEKADPEPKEAVDKFMVRGVLFQLNKKTGKNVSKELIQSIGYDRLDDVKPEDLPKLYEKAKEALDA